MHRPNSHRALHPDTHSKISSLALRSPLVSYDEVELDVGYPSYSPLVAPTPPASHLLLKRQLNNGNSRFFKPKKHTFPEFIDRLEEQWHHLDDNITLKLGYRGYPDPVVTWFKDQQPLVSSPRMMLLAGDGHTELIIFGAQTTDAGFYTCRIEQNMGVRETHCQLHVGEANGKNSNGVKLNSGKSPSHRLYKSLLYTPAQYYSRF